MFLQVSCACQLFYKNEKELKAKALELLKIFDLDGDAETLAKNLAYGQQRRLENCSCPCYRT